MNISKVLFLLLWVCDIVYGLDYLVLKKEYSFKGQAVYAKDIFPELENNFLLFEIPQNMNRYQIKSNQLIEQFEDNGLSIGAETPIITFKRTFSGEKESIENYIMAEFLRHYQKNKIQIKSIQIEQITPVGFQKEDIKSIDFHPKLLKRNEGSFNVVIQEKLKEQTRNRKVYFKYLLDAEIQAIQTTQPINGRQSVNLTNARLVWIPFERIGSALMEENELGKVAVRSYTPKDIIVTRDRLIPKRVVKKGDMILVDVMEDNVLLEFTLEAQKDAAIGDVIKARVIDGKKVYDVEIIEEGRGRLL